LLILIERYQLQYGTLLKNLAWLIELKFSK
jgi:hypothetical protein